MAKSGEVFAVTVTESERLALYDKMKTQIGTPEVETLINLLPGMDWNSLATNDEVRHQGLALRADISEETASLRVDLRGEMAELRTHLRGEMAHLRTDLRGEMAHLRVDLLGQLQASERRIILVFAGFAMSIWASIGAAIVTVVYAG